MRHITIIVAALMVQGACASPTAQPLSVEVTSDSGSSGLARFTVRNVTADPVFVDRCGDHILPAVDRRVGSGWENAAAGICILDEPDVALRLEAGETARDSVRIPIPGTYRLRIGIRVADPSSDLGVATSAGFSVR